MRSALGRHRPVCGNCDHSVFAHDLRRGKRRGCVHASGDEVCQCPDYVEKQQSEPVTVEMPPAPPRVALTDRHGDAWTPHAEFEWRRDRDDYVTTWPNVLGLHGPITYDPDGAVTGG